jgi:hypothetical protein
MDHFGCTVGVPSTEIMGVNDTQVHQTGFEPVELRTLVNASVSILAVGMGYEWNATVQTVQDSTERLVPASISTAQKNLPHPAKKAMQKVSWGGRHGFV